MNYTKLFKVAQKYYNLTKAGNDLEPKKEEVIEADTALHKFIEREQGGPSDPLNGLSLGDNARLMWIHMKGDIWLVGIEDTDTREIINLHTSDSFKDMPHRAMFNKSHLVKMPYQNLQDIVEWAFVLTGSKI